MADGETTSLRDDLLIGVKAIAEYRGESPRRTVYLLEKRLLPGRKRGRVWESTKSALHRDAHDF
jgi:hypothetical protein